MNCTKCPTQFEYFSEEEEAYKKAKIPLPEACPECRRKRKTIFRNEKALYYNKSAKSGKQVIAVYSPQSPFKVIDRDEWWEDSNDSTLPVPIPIDSKLKGGENIDSMYLVISFTKKLDI